MESLNTPHITAKLASGTPINRVDMMQAPILNAIRNARASSSWGPEPRRGRWSCGCIALGLALLAVELPARGQYSYNPRVISPSENSRVLSFGVSSVGRSSQGMGILGNSRGGNYAQSRNLSGNGYGSSGLGNSAISGARASRAVNRTSGYGSGGYANAGSLTGGSRLLGAGNSSLLGSSTLLGAYGQTA